ncbi:MAG TPA: hypothetical protein VKR06_14480 [Ktedonosporobacter sp.]|nr:hypothetical protein [Ktedonosporobacter sp.]
MQPPPPGNSPSPPAYGMPPASFPGGSGGMPPFSPVPPAPVARPRSRSFSLAVGGLLGLLALIVIVPAGIMLSIVNGASSVRAQSDATSIRTGYLAATVRTSAATATAATSVNPYLPGQGTLVLNDSLKDGPGNSGWDRYVHIDGGCEFSGGSYIVREPDPRSFFSCTALNTNFSDFTYEAQMTFQTSNFGGLLFRRTAANSSGYYFRVESDGYYDLLLYVDKTAEHSKQLKSGHASLSLMSPISNVLAVVAHGNTIDLYINHQKVDTVTDTTYSSGQVGVAVENVVTQKTDRSLAFSNARVWKL